MTTKAVAKENHWTSLRIVSDPYAQPFYERLGAIKVAEVAAPVGGTTRAYATGQSTVTANRLNVHAADTSSAMPSTLVVGVGGVTGAGANSTSQSTDVVVTVRI